MFILSSEVLQVINLVVAFGIPILVGLVTNRFANGATKSLTLFGLAALLAVCVEIIDKGGFDGFSAFMLFAQNFLVAVTAHYGFLKPSGFTGTNGVIQANFAGGLNVGKQSHGPSSDHRRAA